ncbi:cytidylyltransferase family-domain-containing protein [Rhodofomes roseus]|uniref:Phosphatidate cytidylyltransferase n=1 Tax=Rhodofomes roseus TaxID=34475 RepID=A0ABQ8KM88_9APHY|nr:cytidylyltransferase family-domain-containing protein [Rhodofomes roseus]KAH9839213.1 cytidylyltransferase family-domain-containing protein [Rhodofomes roseus]
MSSRVNDTRPSWASRTTFEGLGVESGEESEEEVLGSPSPAPDSGSESATKPSKSAIKKAKEQARLQRKVAARAASKARATSQSPALLPSPDARESSEEAPEIASRSAAEPIAAPTRNAVAARPVPEHLPELVADKPAKPANGDAGTVHEEVSPPEETVFVSSDKAEPSTVSEPPSGSPAPVPDPNLSPPAAETKRREEPPASESKPANGNASQQQENTQDGEKAKKRQSILTRTLWTFIMIGGFLTLLLMGHAYMILLVMLCQTLVYREVTSLFSLKRKDSDEGRGRDPWSKTLNWYFFVITNYFLYGESIIYYFKHVVFADAQFTMFATNHRMISFSLYTLGFVGFVMSLKRGYLKQQFGLFCWVHMTLMMIVVSSHFIVDNILEGMIWFWVPASLVICNDVFAYIWGMTLGRTPLIKLSPKKTVEGFVGAFFSTVVFGVVWATYFMRFNYMICPVHDLGVSAFETIRCDPNPVFVWREWVIPTPARALLSTATGHEFATIAYAPYQFHVFVLACFASLVAPFGGFFASGFKRAFNIKDFGHSIPGHGGMTDRMDCQFLMGVFTYVYYSSLIRQHHVSIGSILQMIVSGLTPEQQLELMADLKRYLEGQGIAVNI